MPHDVLAGYRLLRSLGSGSRADVMLAHPVHGEAAPVVLKLFGAAVSDESVFAEVEALTRAAGEHVVRLHDVVPADDGAPALVLERLAGGSLARLLATRGVLRPGEAVTVLAPVAGAIARMHAAGVAHGALTPASVLFDAAGTPTVACFGRATLHEPGLPIARLELEPAVVDDVLAFGALASGLLEGLPDLARRARTGAAPGPWLLEFADALFDACGAVPVDLEGSGWRAGDRVVPVSDPLPEVEPAATLLVRLRSALGGVRRRVWVAAGAVVVALVAAVAALPQDAPAESDPPPPSASPPSASGPVTADDPVDAAHILLAARESCVRELDVACLDLVDQPGSSALEHDRALIEAIEKGGESTLPQADEVALVQRLGDSALVSLGPDSEPASLLLVKGEAGWRIRDYVE